LLSKFIFHLPDLPHFYPATSSHPCTVSNLQYLRLYSIYLRSIVNSVRLVCICNKSYTEV